MPWATLRKVLFFCCESSDENQDSYNESSHLIPADPAESPMIYSDVVLIDHQQLQERLGLIVRTKEGKMVNVASQVPFNLHNKALPPERFYGSISRSASGSIDQHDSRDHDYQSHHGHSTHGIPRQRTFYTSAYDDGQADGRQTSDQPMPTPILNVRLVGYPDNMNKARGRTRERRSQVMDIPHPNPRVEDEEVATAGNAQTSCEGLIATTSNFKLHDVGSITLNWND